MTTAEYSYAKLLARTLPAVIHTEQENEHYLAILEELDQRPSLNAAERRLAELLTLLIENFEERAYPLKAANPAETLSELMAVNGLKRKDLTWNLRHGEYRLGSTKR